MYADPQARLAPLIASLTLATDLGGGFAPEAALRTAVLAVRLSRACGLEAGVRHDAYWAGALRFLGCTAYSHEESLLMGGDDLAFLQAFADVDLADKPAMLARSVARLAAGRGTAQRLRSLLAFLLDPRGGDKVSSAHCQLAEQLGADLGFGVGVTQVLRDMYERWDGRGAPRRVGGQRLSPATRVLHVAHVLEVYSRMHGLPRALAEVARRAGRHFEPAVAAAAADAGPALWQGLEPGRMTDLFVAEEPAPVRLLAPLQPLPLAGPGQALQRPAPQCPGDAPHAAPHAEDPLLRTARAFAAYADVKSPWTLGHSHEVARVACAAAGRLGWPAPEIRQLEIAALLHDLGRVALPNGLWDVPRAFTAAERERARLHAYHGERVLAGCALLAPLADWAAAAHERADGQGYHRRIAAASLPPAAQLIAAADTWVALRSARPHRAAFGDDEARTLLEAAASNGQLTPLAVRAVLGDSAAAGAVRPADAGAAARLSPRELEVLLRVARGLSNKQIARELQLSPRTVQTHLEHVFDKTGARTRAAAAIFVARHGLVDFGLRGQAG
ncbi:MAG: HD domain-containing protein [Rubrivivax sp.]|nr:HD domain-containing protein [Rubrivivax sp.]